MKVFRVVTSLDFYVWRYQITENAVIHHACFAGGILKNSALAGAARANSSAAAKALRVQRLLNRLRCCTTFKWAQGTSYLQVSPTSLCTLKPRGRERGK